MSSGARSIAWGDGGSLRAPRPYIPVVCVQPHSPLNCVLLSHQIVEVATHWMSTNGVSGKCQTQPHWLPASTCPGCVSGRPIRTKGYVGAVVQGRNGATVCIVELTVNALIEQPRLRDRGVDLRGLKLTLERCSRSKVAKVKAFLSIDRAQADLPAEPVIQRELLRLWGFEEQSPTDDVADLLEQITNAKESN